MVDVASYIGRFAPSPTGPLHLGSLVSALASYLDARAHQGAWLLRIENIDPHREATGAQTAILDALRHHGLHWDGPYRTQSHNKDQHSAIKDQLLASGQAYYCRCSRKDLQAYQGDYSGRCYHLGLGPDPQHGVRLSVSEAKVRFTDRLWGQSMIRLRAVADDFLIWRKDDWPSYHLALVLDDLDVGVTHVVRGHDLRAQTFRQVWLYQLLGHSPPSYCHHPLVTHPGGNKLSKQTLAKPLDSANALNNIKTALRLLNQSVPKSGNLKTVLASAVQNWQLMRLPKTEAFSAHPSS